MAIKDLIRCVVALIGSFFILTIMENKTQLTLSKESTDNEIKMYFEKVLELSKTNDEFPVNLDDVWMLVYSEKGKATRELKRNYIENEDYITFAQNGNGGKFASIEYRLSVSCLEYFIARKVRDVFDVYRKVFHKAAKGELALSDDEILLRSMQILNERIENQRLQLQQANEIIQEQKPKADFYDFAVDDKKLYDMSKVAKMINFKNVGRNKLFEILRQNKILMEDNEPYQKYVTSGSFEMKVVVAPNNNETYTKTYVTKKGIKAIICLLKKKGYEKRNDLPIDKERTSIEQE